MHENDKLQIQHRGYHWESKEEKELPRNSHYTNHVVYLELDGGYLDVYYYNYCTFF